MAIDTNKKPGEQKAEPTGPILERPDHNADQDLPLIDADFEDFEGAS